MILLYLHYNIL